MWSSNPPAAHLVDRLLVDLAGRRERLEDFGLTSVAAGRARPERVTADTVIVDIGREFAHWTRKWPAARAGVEKGAAGCPAGKGHIPAQEPHGPLERRRGTEVVLPKQREHTSIAR